MCVLICSTRCHPEAPTNFSGMTVMDDTYPVTVMFTWDGLVGEGATGIPSKWRPILKLHCHYQQYLYYCDHINGDDTSD